MRVRPDHMLRKQEWDVRTTLNRGTVSARACLPESGTGMACEGP